jgi:tRNA-dihydrouridine synthase
LPELLLDGSTARCGLAPMEGVTDFATRLWYQMVGGMDFTWTPFFRVTDSSPGKWPDAFAPELSVLKGLFPVPLVVQVMGSRAIDIIRTANILGERVSYLDLNCGCPSPTVVGSRAGSSLLQSSEYFGTFIEQVVTAVGPSRLSIKMRTGYSDAREFPALIATIKDQPLRHLTVHGRTRPDRYTGLSNWDLIELAAETMACPVIGSGDICDKESFRQKIKQSPKVQTRIIGRGALRNPWIFSDGVMAPVLTAFVAFVVMQDIGVESHDVLVRWAAERGSQKFGGLSDSDWWSEILSLLALRNQNPKRIEDIEVTTRALSRGKMLWNYLRSSLPQEFMEPTLMRQSKLSDLVSNVQAIAKQATGLPANLPLNYRPELDWMYSGEGRGPKKLNGATTK